MNNQSTVTTAAPQPTLDLLTKSLSMACDMPPGDIDTSEHLQVREFLLTACAVVVILTSLPPWNELTALAHLTVAGNPLCRNAWVGTGRVKDLMDKEGEGCVIQCSDMCLDLSRSDQGCDYQCNVPECNYDNFQCRYT